MIYYKREQSHCHKHNATLKYISEKYKGTLCQLPLMMHPLFKVEAKIAARMIEHCWEFDMCTQEMAKRVL